MKESEIAMATEDLFEQMNAVWLRGKKVERSTPPKNGSSDSGEKESYDAMLIATGSEPVMPQIPGLSSARPWCSERWIGPETLLPECEGSKTAIVLGAGLIGDARSPVPC
jgi:NAD(P)H-nitrite reductase large subunit